MITNLQACITKSIFIYREKNINLTDKNRTKQIPILIISWCFKNVNFNQSAMFKMVL